MSPLTIDLPDGTVDLLLPTDNPVLRDAIEEATRPAPSAGDGAGFDNAGFDNKL